jgi:hypothetical protein
MWGYETSGMRPEVINHLPGYRLVAQASVPVQADRPQTNKLPPIQR